MTRTIGEAIEGRLHEMKIKPEELAADGGGGQRRGRALRGIFAGDGPWRDGRAGVGGGQRAGADRLHRQLRDVNADGWYRPEGYGGCRNCMFRGEGLPMCRRAAEAKASIPVCPFWQRRDAGERRRRW